MMDMSFDFPPNYDQISKTFKLHKNVVFTYGQTLYNPDRIPIPDPLKIHEGTHTIQQGKDPALWWERYLIDSEFRLKQEAEAYGYKYYVYCKKVKDRNKRA